MSRELPTKTVSVNQTDQRVADVYKRRCNRMLTAMVGVDLVESWWVSSNKSFSGQTPASVFEREPEAVYNYLMSHMSGGYS